MPSSGRTCRDTGPKNQRARSACLARTSQPRSAPDGENVIVIMLNMNGMYDLTTDVSKFRFFFVDLKSFMTLGGLSRVNGIVFR